MKYMAMRIEGRMTHAYEVGALGMPRLFSLCGRECSSRARAENNRPIDCRLCLRIIEDSKRPAG